MSPSLHQTHMMERTPLLITKVCKKDSSAGTQKPEAKPWKLELEMSVCVQVMWVHVPPFPSPEKKRLHCLFKKRRENSLSLSLSLALRNLWVTFRVEFNVCLLKSFRLVFFNLSFCVCFVLLVHLLKWITSHENQSPLTELDKRALSCCMESIRKWLCETHHQNVHIQAVGEN